MAATMCFMFVGCLAQTAIIIAVSMNYYSPVYYSFNPGVGGTGYTLCGVAVWSLHAWRLLPGDAGTGQVIAKP